jgi:hypothetical protein
MCYDSARLKKRTASSEEIIGDLLGFKTTQLVDGVVFTGSGY